MTPTQKRLHDAIMAALADGTVWQRVPEASGFTIRYDERDLATPDWAQKPGIYGGGAPYPFPTYNRMVFLTIVPGEKWYLSLRVARAPWVGCHDQTVTFKRAFEVLADPAACWDRP